MPLPDSIRILGIPWRVEQPEVIDDDPDTQGWARTELCVLEVAAGTPPAKKGWLLLWCILYALSEDLTFGDADPSVDELKTIRTTLYTAIKDNWAAVQRWFGLDGEPPAVEETTLHLHGMDVPLTRPYLVPGLPAKILGQARYHENVIYVRSILPPHKAAAAALHEMAHWVLQPVCRLGTEEAFIRPVALALSAVFFDNPEAMRLLFEEADLA